MSLQYAKDELKEIAKHNAPRMILQLIDGWDDRLGSTYLPTTTNTNALFEIANENMGKNTNYPRLCTSQVLAPKEGLYTANVCRKLH